MFSDACRFFDANRPDRTLRDNHEPIRVDDRSTDSRMRKAADQSPWEVFLTALDKAAEGDYTKRIETGQGDDALLARAAAAVNTLLDKTQKRIDGLETFVRDQARDARRYRHMLDTMEESYFEVDLKGNLEFHNETVVRDTGYSESELRGMNFKQLADEQSHERVYSTFHQVFLTGQAVKGFDWVIRKKDGGVIDVEASVALLRDASGKPCGFRGVVRDVTGRKRSEQALVASRRKYRDILENMEETYLETDLKGNFLFFNDSLCRVLGYSRSELQGTNYRLISPPENLYSIRKMFHEIYVTGQRKTFFNHRLIAKNGSDIYLEMSISLLRSPSGEPLGFAGVGRDVTEKLAAERQLVERERRLRLITDNIRDVIWTMDFDWNYTYISPSIQHLIGYTPEEVKRTPFGKTVPPDIFKKMQKGLAEALAREKDKNPVIPGESRIYEVPLRRRDGEIVWTEVRSNFNRDENGNPFELVGVVRDITERKKVQDALAESEAIYRKTLETTSDGVAIIQEGRYVYFNERFLSTLGIPEGYQAGGEPLGALMHPDDRTAVLDSYGKHLRGQSAPSKHEVRVIRPDGKMITLMVTSAATVYRGKPAVLNFMQDITEAKRAEQALKESEQRHRLIAENVDDIIWTMDFDMNWTYLSPSVQRLTGFSADEILRIPVRAMLPPETYSRVRTLIDEELAKEKNRDVSEKREPVTIQMPLMRKDGSVFWVELSANFNRDENGRPFEIVGVTRNISERKKAEEALLASEQRYRILSENINDVIWILDLNMNYLYVTPSNSRITGYTTEEVMRSSLAELITPDSLERAGAVLAEELAVENSGQPVNPNRSRMLVIEAKAKGGGTVWLEVIATFNRDAENRPTEILAVGRDITERRRMEQALAESEHRYRLIAENVNDIVWTIGLDLKFLYVSPSSTRVTGYSPEEVMNDALEKVLSPDSYLSATRRLAEELELQKDPPPEGFNRAVTLEVEAIHKNGNTFWLEVTGTFNRDSTGAITEILAVGRDITERKKVQQSLKESEQRYRMIVENVHDSIAILDLDLNYLYVSPAEEKITGFKPEEIAKIPLREQMTPASYARVERAFAEEIELEFSGKPLDPNRSRTLELEVYHKNGGTIWEELTAAFTRDGQGRPNGLMITTRNVTERIQAEEELKRSEQRYRMIIENMREVIWTTDLSLNNTYVSPSCRQLTGYTPEEILKTSPEQIMTPESMAVTANIVQEEMNREFSGEPADPHRTRTLEQEIICKDGSTVWLEVTGTFIRDEQGQATGMLMAGRDVTARKKAENERTSLEQQLMQAQKMETVGRLAGGVAHDFNNMLSVILGYVDLAKMRLARQHPVLKDIAEIEKAALRSRDITMQLLAFSRKQVIEPKIVDLCELVAHTQKAIARLIGEDIDLTVLAGDGIGAVKIDPSQVEQILINLAVNARDAMLQGGKLIIEIADATLDEAYCERHIGSTPGRYVRLSVSDNGTGMDKETLKHIFEPFFTTKEEGKGTGLGLATVYGIIKQNDGYINVYSEPGYGTTFSLYLPSVGDIIDKQDSAEDSDIDLTGSGRILLVEDDPMVLQIARGMLESLGYWVTATHHPKEAIAIFTEAEEPFDLVITDVVMPSMSGKDLKSRLNETRPDLKVLFMSGYTADIIAHHGVLEEGIQFLQKPFTIQSLARKVNDILLK